MTHWQFSLGAGLVAISVLIYDLQIEIFHNAHDTFFYLMQDLAFVPVQVLLTTLFINHMMGIREKRALLKKMNMLIGVFFSEIGLALARECFSFDRNAATLKGLMLVDASWDSGKFNNAIAAIKQHVFEIDARAGDLLGLKQHLQSKRKFLTSLLANPNLLEHDTFTELMWAVFHLAEELGYRSSVADLPKADYAHLGSDITRVYALLVLEWLAYMKHLKQDYPYLFSLAIRSNPFNDAASIIIHGSELKK